MILASLNVIFCGRNAILTCRVLRGKPGYRYFPIDVPRNFWIHQLLSHYPVPILCLSRQICLTGYSRWQRTDDVSQWNGVSMFKFTMMTVLFFCLVSQIIFFHTNRGKEESPHVTFTLNNATNICFLPGRTMCNNKCSNSRRLGGSVTSQVG